MRFIVFFVILGSWSFMWWWTYVFHVKDCTSMVRGVDGKHLSMTDVKYPVGFIWGEGSPVVTNDFSEWIDSISGTLREDEILSITGLAYRDEVTGLDVEYLARARGRAIARLFDEKMPRERLTFDGRIGEITSDIRAKVFEGFELQKLTRNAEIHESETCTVMHYPYDSLSLVRSREVERFFEELVEEVRKSNITVEIMPAVSMTSAKEAGNRLLEWRLYDIRNTLLERTDSLARVQLHPVFKSVDEFCSLEVRDLDQSWFVVKKK
jgi:hypothetical protein